MHTTGRGQRCLRQLYRSGRKRWESSAPVRRGSRREPDPIRFPGRCPIGRAGGLLLSVRQKKTYWVGLDRASRTGAESFVFKVLRSWKIYIRDICPDICVDPHVSMPCGLGTGLNCPAKTRRIVGGTSTRRSLVLYRAPLAASVPAQEKGDCRFNRQSPKGTLVRSCCQSCRLHHVERRVRQSTPGFPDSTRRPGTGRG